jgi:hypothetical protein
MEHLRIQRMITILSLSGPFHYLAHLLLHDWDIKQNFPVLPRTRPAGFEHGSGEPWKQGCGNN